MESSDPTEMASEFSVGEQDSIFGDAAHVDIWDAMSLENSDDEWDESGTA